MALGVAGGVATLHWASRLWAAFRVTAPHAPQHVPSVPWTGLLLAVLAALRLLWRATSVAEEAVLMVRDLGVQLTTTYHNGRTRCEFVDLSTIQSVILNEGITMQRVVVYLAFLVHGRSTMVVAFPNVRLPLRELKGVFREVHDELSRAQAQQGGLSVEALDGVDDGGGMFEPQPQTHHHGGIDAAPQSIHGSSRPRSAPGVRRRKQKAISQPGDQGIAEEPRGPSLPGARSRQGRRGLVLSAAS